MSEGAHNIDPLRRGEPSKAIVKRESHAPPHDAGVAGVERMASVVHEIRNLVDGSLRCVRLAKHTLEVESTGQQSALKQLETATTALERMAGLVHAAMQGPSLSIGSVMVAGAEPVSLREAMAHTFDVLKPLADLNRAEMHVQFGPGLAEMPAGALYTVLINGVRNAIESIGRRDARGGRVDVTVMPVESAPWWSVHRRDWIEIRVTDDGVGFESLEEAEYSFMRGVTSKRNGAGIGLALAREIVQEMGGRIELLPRAVSAETGRGGAVLKVIAPVQVRPTSFIGGGA